MAVGFIFHDIKFDEIIEKKQFIYMQLALDLS